MLSVPSHRCCDRRGWPAIPAARSRIITAQDNMKTDMLTVNVMKRSPAKTKREQYGRFYFFVLYLRSPVSLPQSSPPPRSHLGTSSVGAAAGTHARTHALFRGPWICATFVLCPQRSWPVRCHRIFHIAPQRDWWRDDWGQDTQAFAHRHCG